VDVSVVRVALAGSHFFRLAGRGTLPIAAFGGIGLDAAGIGLISGSFQTRPRCPVLSRQSEKKPFNGYQQEKWLAITTKIVSRHQKWIEMN